MEDSRKSKSRRTANKERAETALLGSEQRYRLLIDNIPTVAWISSEEGKTIFISENVEKIYGYSSNEILAGGETLWFGRIHPEDKNRVRESFKILFSENREYKIEYRIQRKDGEWIWILDRANVVEELNGQQYAYGVFSDITESKQAEDALQLYVDRLKILYQINQGILIAQSPTEIAETALKWIRQLIPCQRAGVILFGSDKSQAKIYALDVDGETKFAAGTNIQLDQMNIDELMEKLARGQTVVQEYYPTDNVSEILYTEGTRVFIHVPLIHENELIGTLNLARPDTFTLTSIQEDIVREVAAQLSIAIRQTELRETEKRRRQELELLEHISTALRHANTLDDLYSMLVKEFKALFQPNAGAILISQDQRMEYALIYGAKKLKKQLRNTQNIADKLSQILLLGQAHFVPEQEFGLQEVHSAAVLPFQSQKNILGGAILFWNAPHEFSKEETHVLMTIADVAGIALHRMKILETLEQQVEDRTRDLSALYDVTAVSSRSLDLQEILDQSLVKVLEAMKSDIGIIHLLDKSGKTVQMVSYQGLNQQMIEEFSFLPKDYMLVKDILEQQKAIVIPDLAADSRVKEVAFQVKGLPYAGVPIRVKDRILGLLSVIGSAGSSYNEEAISLLTSISDQIGIAIENARLYEQAKQAAILSERHRLARDLHDSVTQSLYSLNLMAATGQKLLESDSDKEKIVHTFKRLGMTAHQALKEMRLLLYELRPSALEKEGLVDALRQRLEAVEGRAEITTYLHADELPKLPADIEEGLYHIAQEALNNALKHAENTQVDVDIHMEKDLLKLDIRDYGKGFIHYEQDHSSGMGLTSMMERARLIGGDLKITSEPGKGTCISVYVKVPQVEAS